METFYYIVTPNDNSSIYFRTYTAENEEAAYSEVINEFNEWEYKIKHLLAEEIENLSDNIIICKRRKRGRNV